MRLQCHGRQRTVQVRGEPPPGRVVAVTCPACGAVNRFRAPAPPEPAAPPLNDGQRKFMDFIRKTIGGDK